MHSVFDNAKLIVFRINRRKITGAKRNYHQLAIYYLRRNRWRALRDYLRDDFKENLNLIFGLASMVMGISAIMNMVNMPAVIFAVVIGTIVGLA